MMSVPELMVASSMPRLVHDSAHHLYCSWSAWTPMRRRRAGIVSEIAILRERKLSAGTGPSRAFKPLGYRGLGGPPPDHPALRRVRVPVRDGGHGFGRAGD